MTPIIPPDDPGDHGKGGSSGGGGLTDAELRASPVPVSVSGEVEVKNDSGNPLPVSGSVSVSNFPATQPISGTVAVSNFPASVEVSNDVGNPLPVSGTITANAGTGTFAVSAATLPLPAGAATSVLQTTGNVSLSSIDSKLTSPLSVTGVLTDTQLRAAPVPISGTVTVTDGSGPLTIDGTVTANIGTTNGLALDATLTGGTQKSILHGITKGTTTAADATVTTVDINHNALDVNIASGTLSVTTTSVSTSFTHNQTGSILASAQSQLVVASNPALQGVLIKALPANTGTVYVGLTGVTTATGFPVEAGENITLPIDNANKIFVRADVDGQSVAWVAI